MHLWDQLDKVVSADIAVKPFFPAQFVSLHASNVAGWCKSAGTAKRYWNLSSCSAVCKNRDGGNPPEKLFLLLSGRVSQTTSQRTGAFILVVIYVCRLHRHRQSHKVWLWLLACTSTCKMLVSVVSTLGRRSSSFCPPLLHNYCCCRWWGSCSYYPNCHRRFCHCRHCCCLCNKRSPQSITRNL